MLGTGPILLPTISISWMMLWNYCKGSLVALSFKAYITQMFGLHCFCVESIFFLLGKEIAFETNKWECSCPFWSYFKDDICTLGMFSNNFNAAWKLSDFVFHFFILCASAAQGCWDLFFPCLSSHVLLHYFLWSPVIFISHDS